MAEYVRSGNSKPETGNLKLVLWNPSSAVTRT
jgi:hypothetical protein